jgi:hypothetical protein
MWVRGAAIKKVPSHAVVEEEMLEEVEAELARDGEVVRDELDRAFIRFEETQPEIADYVSDVLSGPLDDTALALGYFLSIAVWLAFERAFGERLRPVGREALHETSASLALEEELRKERATDPFDVEDVIGVEQPNVVRFVNAHVDTALEVGDGDLLHDHEVDVDDVHHVYRAILVLTLALSHSVTAPDGRTVGVLYA